MSYSVTMLVLDKHNYGQYVSPSQSMHGWLFGNKSKKLMIDNVINNTSNTVYTAHADIYISKFNKHYDEQYSQFFTWYLFVEQSFRTKGFPQIPFLTYPFLWLAQVYLPSPPCRTPLQYPRSHYPPTHKTHHLIHCL